MFFVRMIRLVPLVAVLLVLALVIYLVAQAKYNPARAKQIVINVFIWITSILTGIFLLICGYCLLDNMNIAAFELFLSFAAVPAIGLAITLVCRTVFLHHNPTYRNKANRAENNETFKQFWGKRLKKGVKSYLNNKFGNH